MHTKSWSQSPCFISGRHVRVEGGHHEFSEALGQRPTSRPEALQMALQISLLNKPRRFKILTPLSVGSPGTLPASSLLVLHGALWCGLLRNGVEMPMGGPVVIAVWGVKGETSSSPPGYLTPTGSSAYIAGSGFSEAQVCKRGIWVGLIVIENPGSLKLVFFSGKHHEGPFSVQVHFFPFAWSRKTVDVSVLL